MQEPGLTHLDEQGRARMVDVGQKPVSARQAVAEAYVILQSATLRSIVEGKVPKGEVLGTARVAAIMAAKKCGELIPLCHPLPIESATVNFELPEASTEQNARLRIVASVQITAKTGVEMEALTAVSVAALTIYDMCKAIDKSMVIEGIRLLKKSGGTHGDYEAKDQR